jgi:hypothetical protein
VCSVPCTVCSVQYSSYSRESGAGLDGNNPTVLYIKHYRGNISKGNYRGGKFSRGEISEGNLRRGIFRGKFSGGNIRRGIFVGGESSQIRINFW